ncbi:MAG TPA: hypothetical protein EYH29_07305 [Caldilineales bacterium]|nr:hypothetical protein [Caldilineales bacterium]
MYIFQSVRNAENAGRAPVDFELNFDVHQVTPTFSGPTATPFPSPTPAPNATPVERLTTEELIRLVEVPPNDPIDLAARLRPELGQVPRVVNATPPSYEEGDVISFWVGNSDTDENWQIQAELVVKGEHVYMWREVGAKVKEKDLRKATTFFDERIYPTNRTFFGSEWSPGIDNDPRLHVLHARNLGGTIAGYFSSADEIPRAIHPYSNEKEMFYINVDNNRPGSDFYNGTLAHEFQHMIHWWQDKNEESWMNEGASELAMQLNGLRRNALFSPDSAFAENPDLQLNTWPDTDESYAHYGNAYLFMSYFLSRFGDDATKALVANDKNGMEAVADVLQTFGTGLTAEDFFADWIVANWLDDPNVADGRWDYPDYELDSMATTAEFDQLPVRFSDTVHQYAADYYTIPVEGDSVTISFTGDPQTRLAATDAHSGKWAWWSNRVDASDTRLTFPVDLTGANEATLHYFVWYDIEALWDYAYVEVSEDGGATWTLLETERTTRENPNGNAYGPGYTGKSMGDFAGWVEEQVDLSPYAGKSILVRFEYVTDAAVTQPGMFIDDVSIPEIDYYQDFENGPGDWQSEGWLLTDNVLQERWLVQVIERRSPREAAVHRMAIGPDGRGELHLTGLDDFYDLVLAVSALAPATVEKGSYQFEVRGD